MDSENEKELVVTEKGSMPFLEHLEELRRRLLKSIVIIVVMALASFYFSNHIVEFLKRPLGGVPLYNMEVTGTFYAYLKISLITGLVVSAPFVFYQLWSFISPGLYQREKVVVLPLVLSSTVLFVIGGAFCYLAVLPIAFKFLTHFAGELVINNITISSYISFTGLMMLAFGVCFQLPVAAYFLGKIGLVNVRILSKGRRYAIVIILIVGAILTPPDVFTQVLLATPLYALYEVSILVVWFVGRKRKRQEIQESDSE